MTFLKTRRRRLYVVRRNRLCQSKWNRRRNMWKSSMFSAIGNYKKCKGFDYRLFARAWYDIYMALSMKATNAGRKTDLRVPDANIPASKNLPRRKAVRCRLSADWWSLLCQRNLQVTYPGIMHRAGWQQRRRSFSGGPANTHRLPCARRFSYPPDYRPLLFPADKPGRSNAPHCFRGKTALRTGFVPIVTNICAEFSHAIIAAKWKWTLLHQPRRPVKGRVQ